MKIKDFVQLPFLSDIKDTPRWTITVKKDERKMPININQLLLQGKIWGATEIDNVSPYMTLTDMATHPALQDISNVCLQLSQTMKDGFVVLDIEPECPDDIKQQMMQLPWIYAETSMSGTGIHLVLPSPDTHPEILETKACVKYGKYYEILLNHNITFTMNQITPEPWMHTKPMSDFIKIWEDLAENTLLTQTLQMDTDDLPRPEDIPHCEKMLQWLYQADYGKKQEDFLDRSGKPDISAWEFGVIGFYKYRMQMLMQINPYASHQYSDQEKLIILHEIVKEKVPHREKHDEIREGLPKLMWDCKRALTLVVKNNTQKDEENKT